MNATLTGIGIALVLALVAALVAPFFIDWSAYRTVFEARAGAMLGVPVRVLGPVDVRLLPSPQLRFVRVVAGRDGVPARLEAESFALELALPALLKGEILVTDLAISGARLTATLDESGRLILPIDANAAGQPDPATTTIERFRMERAEIELREAEHRRRHILKEVSLSGEATSLRGPFKLEGTAVHEGSGYAFRVNTGRVDAAGAARLKLGVEPLNSARLFELDGALSVPAGQPRFEGTAVLARPPVRVGERGDRGGESWRLAGRVKADRRRILVEGVDIQHGAEERQLRIGGSAEIGLGAAPEAALALATRQLDVDRALGAPKDAGARPPTSLAHAFLQRFPLIAEPPIPVRARLSADAVVLAGDLVQGFAAEIRTEGRRGWAIERLEARLPGAAPLAVSGVVDMTAAAPRFAGRVALEAGDVPTLVHWLEGGGDAGRRESAVRRLALSGRVEAGGGAVEVEELALTADGESLRGRLAWRAGAASNGRARVTADLASERLDLDRLDIGRLAALAGVGGQDLGRTDLDIKARADRLAYGGVTARGVDADLSVEAGATDIRRLAVEDLGGARIDAAGRLAVFGERPGGRVEARIDAKKLAGLISVLRATSAPGWIADLLAERAPVLEPLAVAAEITAEQSAQQGVTARLSGEAGGTNLALSGTSAQLTMDAPVEARLDASAADTARLLAQVGVPTAPFVAAGPGRISAAFSGPPGDGAKLALEGELAGISGRLDGVVRGRLGAGPGVAGTIELAAQDLAPFAVLLGRAPPGVLPKIPLTASGRLETAADGFTLDALRGRLAGRDISGRLAYGKASLSGALAIAALDAEELAALAFGPLVTGPGPATASAWPSAPIGPGPLDGLSGRVELTTPSLLLGSGLEARDARLALVLKPEEIGLENVAAVLAGGGLAGSMSVRRQSGTAAVGLRLALTDARFGELGWVRGGAPAADGLFDLAAEVQGSGRSLAEIVGALSGGGTFALTDARLQGFDPAAFARVVEAADKGLALEPDRVRAAMAEALARGALPVQEIAGAFTVASGVARVGNAAVRSGSVSATASIAIDLPQLRIAGETAVSPTEIPGGAGASPQLLLKFDGPLSAPRRSLDVTPLTGFLTVRALEREMARVEALEAERRERQARAREEEARRQVEAEARRRAEAEAQARRAAEEEARRRAEAEAQARRSAEEEARRRVEAEALARRQAEERRRAEEAQARRQAEEEARRRAEAERAGAARAAAPEPLRPPPAVQSGPRTNTQIIVPPAMPQGTPGPPLVLRPGQPTGATRLPLEPPPVSRTVPPPNRNILELPR